MCIKGSASKSVSLVGVCSKNPVFLLPSLPQAHCGERPRSIDLQDPRGLNGTRHTVGLPVECLGTLCSTLCVNQRLFYRTLQKFFEQTQLRGLRAGSPKGTALRKLLFIQMGRLWLVWKTETSYWLHYFFGRCLLGCVF